MLHCGGNGGVVSVRFVGERVCLAIMACLSV